MFEIDEASVALSISTPFPQPPLPLYTIYQGGQQNKSNSRRLWGRLLLVDPMLPYRHRRWLNIKPTSG